MKQFVGRKDFEKKRVQMRIDFLNEDISVTGSNKVEVCCTKSQFFGNKILSECRYFFTTGILKNCLSFDFVNKS